MELGPRRDNSRNRLTQNPTGNLSMVFGSIGERFPAPLNPNPHTVHSVYLIVLGK